MLVTKQLTVAIEFHNMIKNTMDVNGYHQLLGELSLSTFIIYAGNLIILLKLYVIYVP